MRKDNGRGSDKEGKEEKIAPCKSRPGVSRVAERDELKGIKADSTEQYFAEENVWKAQQNQATIGMCEVLTISGIVFESIFLHLIVNQAQPHWVLSSYSLRTQSGDPFVYSMGKKVCVNLT